MKQSVGILFFTGACAIAASFLASIWEFREDFASAVGGVAGFALANGVTIALRGLRVSGVSDKESSTVSQSFELGFAYGVFAIVYFSLVGWLTGYLHRHGEFAGTVCGGLGGFILAVIVPSILGSSFMSTGRRLQIAIAGVAFVAMLSIVWVMYEHEIR